MKAEKKKKSGHSPRSAPSLFKKSETKIRLYLATSQIFPFHSRQRQHIYLMDILVSPRI